MPLIIAAQTAGDPRRGRSTGLQPRLTRHPHPHAPSHVRRAYDLDEIEARSLGRLKFHQTLHPFWANVNEVADYLVVVRSRVRQLLDQNRLPYLTAPNGRRYVRRHQLEVIANARDARAGRFG